MGVSHNTAFKLPVGQSSDSGKLRIIAVLPNGKRMEYGISNPCKSFANRTLLPTFGRITSTDKNDGEEPDTIQIVWEEVGIKKGCGQLTTSNIFRFIISG